MTFASMLFHVANEIVATFTKVLKKKKNERKKKNFKRSYRERLKVTWSDGSFVFELV